MAFLKQHNPTARKFRLRTALVVPFVLQIIAAVGLVGYLSFKNGQKAINSLAYQLTEEVSNRIDQEVIAYFNKTHQVLRVTYDAVESGNLKLNNFERLQRYFWHVVKEGDLESYLMLGNEQGEFVGVEHREDDTVQLKIRTKSTEPFRETYLLDNSGNRKKFLKKTEYETRKRPWYQAAVQAKKPTWSPIYPFFSRQATNTALGMSAVVPIFDANKQLEGVLCINVTLLRVTDFLKNLYISPHGQSFIIERSGNLVVSSTIRQPFTLKGKGEDAKVVRIPVIESKNATIKATAQSLLKRFGNFNTISKNQQLKFQVNGAWHYAQIRPIQDGRGIDWLVVVVVPESDFMAQINKNTQITILLCIVALIVATGMGFLTARGITGPILSITEAAEEMAGGNLDQRVASSPIGEIEKLANSFNSMAGQLKESFAALRQSEATNRAIVTTIPDLLIRAKGDGTYLESTSIDSAATKSVKKIVSGSSIYDTLPAELDQQRLFYIQQALQTGEMQVYEHQVLVDNQPRDEEVRIVVIQDDEVLIIVRDITDRKQTEAALRLAEENYRGIFENALEGIFQSSPDGHLLRANPAMARIFGYDSSEEMIATITNLSDQIYVDSTQRDEFDCLMQQQGQTQNFECQAYRQDGSMIWVEIDARAIQDNNGKVLYYEGIIQNISDRKHQKEILEAMVKQRTAELQAVNAEIAVLNQRLKSENLRMGAELDILRQMQQLILPKNEELAAIEELDIAGFMQPADEVGGDYYDVLQTDDVVTIGIGDVTGHGLESGILMVMTQTAVRTLSEIREVDPVRFLDTLNRTIYKNVKRMNSEKNLTLAILNYASGKLSISGQHEETLVVRKGGHLERIDTMDLGFPIGLEEQIADFINHTTVELEPGDGVVLYTDGIPEARDINKQFYGLEGLCEVVTQHWHLDAKQIKQAAIDDLRGFIGEQKVFDDITLVVLKRKDEQTVN